MTPTTQSVGRRARVGNLYFFNNGAIMILSFKKEFVPLILNGTKIHTIREDKKNRWSNAYIVRPTMIKRIHMATGVRTKNYKCFKDTFFHLGSQHIAIRHEKDKTIVSIDNKIVPNSIVLLLSLNDGFKTMDDFFAWFNKDFSGKIIHWTPFRYCPF